MADKSIRSANAVIGQSGGPTAVINQSLVGVIEGLKAAGHTGRILGAHHAVRGMVKRDFIELHQLPQDRLDRLAATPSAALGSTRDKPDDEYCRKIFESLKEQDVHLFFYIGGNDSSDTCRIVNELSNEAGYELRCFHVPKTIDNDLPLNDHTPGYGSAARVVACAVMGDNLDNRALPGIKIDVIMGRHAGWLTAASILARKNPEDGPHLIYVPEVPFDDQRFLQDVDRVYKKQGRCVVAVSEGIHDGIPTGHEKHGTPIGVKLAVQQGHHVERDNHGNVQLSGSGALGDFLSIHIRKNLGEKLRVRADTLGYMQRSFAGCVSPVDQHEARMAGRRAAELAMSGDIDGSVAIQRVGDEPYRVEYKRINLADVAGKTRHLDEKYIDGTNNVAESFIRFVSPLVGRLPTVELLRMSES